MLQLVRLVNGPITRLFVTFESPSSSKKCLIDHLEPVQRWRISQLDWFVRLSKMKRFMYILSIFLFGWVVLGFRMTAFLLQTIYAVISACASRGIEYMTRNSPKVSSQPLMASRLTMAENNCSPDKLPLPDSEHVSDFSAHHDSSSSFSLTLSQIAETLQMPSIFKNRRYIDALSAPVPQPRATLHLIARMWLKFGIFVSSCDLAIDKWYLNRAALLQELVAALDSQQAAVQRLTEAAVEHHLPRDVELLPPHETGLPVVSFQVAEPEVPSHSTAIIDIAPKVVATRLRMRRPREPWMLLWGNLHVPKIQQVSFLHMEYSSFQ